MLAGYRVTRLLGRGGMGEVWAATAADETLEVAIKVLLPTAALKPDLVARFEREAQVTASIESEYVCKLLASERDKSGAHLLVFEKLDGESLAERLKREVYLPFAEVGPIVADSFAGLSAAHAAGVVHRDLKPGNIFLAWPDEPQPRERATTLAFGSSHLTTNGKSRPHEPRPPDPDAATGPFPYMRPEQVHNAAQIDEQTDIYAIKTVTFRTLAGRLPFEGTNAGMIIALKLDRPAPSLSEVTDERWPAALERFLSRALKREPEERFASATEALRAWRGVLPDAVMRRSVRPPAHDTVTEPFEAEPAVDQPSRMTDP